MTRRHLIATTVVLMLASSPAFADDTAEMKRLTEEASRLYQAEDYEKAAEKFLDAYDAEAHSTLLKNAAVAWFKAERCDEAVEWSSAFEKRAAEEGALDPKDVTDLKVIRAKCFVRDARSALADGDFDEADAALARVPEDLEHAETVALVDEMAAEIEQARTEAAEYEADEPATVAASGSADASGGGSGWAVAGWSATAAGVALLATQGVVRLMLAEDISTVQSLQEEYGCDGNDCSQPVDASDAARWSDAQGRVDAWDGTREALLIGSGSVLLGVGVTILAVHYLGGEDRVAIGPTIDGDGVGAAFQLRF